MATTIERPVERGGLSARMALRIQIACLALTAAGLLLAVNRSFDHTDEAYYVAWIREPTDFKFLIHPFSHFFKPWYDLFGQSIVGLRLFGYALVAGTGALLGLTLQRFYERRFGHEAGDRSLVVLGTFFSLGAYASWLLTPNYNLLANAGAALLLAGALSWLTPGSSRTSDRLASVTIGLGAWMAFFGKPTLAALAAVAVLALLIMAARRNLALAIERAAIVGLACVVPLVVTVLYVQPPADFVAMIVAGTEALQFGNSLAQIPIKAARELYEGPPILFVTATALIFCIVRSRSRDPGDARQLRILVWGLLAVVALSLLRAITTGGFLTSLMLFCGIMAMIALGLLRDKPAPPVPLRELAPVFVLLAIPFAVAVGSANALLFQLGASVFALMLAAVVAARLLFSPPAARLIATTLTVAFAGLMLLGAFRPYGMPQSMFAQTEPIDLPFSRDRLYVDAPTKAYVDGPKATAARLRLPPGTPIVDLSGTGPGNAMFLRGRAPAFPWLINYTDGAPILADAVWESMTPEERARAWILGPVHPGIRKAGLVGRLAADQSGYECVATLPNGYWADEAAVLTLWRPVGNGGPAGTCGRTRLVPPQAVPPR